MFSIRSFPLFHAKKLQRERKIISTLKKKDFFIKFTLVQQQLSELRGEIVRKDGKYYFTLENESLLLTEDGDYNLDIETKSYSKYQSFDLNYHFFDSIFNGLTLRKIETRDGKDIFYCKNRIGKKILLIHENGELSNIELFLFSLSNPIDVHVIEFGKISSVNILL